MPEKKYIYAIAGNFIAMAKCTGVKKNKKKIETVCRIKSKIIAHMLLICSVHCFYFLLPANRETEGWS